MVSKVEVCYVSHTAALGGAERSLVDLAGALDPDRFERRALLPARGPLAEALESSGVQVEVDEHLRTLHRRGALRRRILDSLEVLRGARDIAGRIARQPPDLLHANTTTAAMFAQRAARVSRVPLVWHVRDLTPLGWWADPLVKRSARVLCTSRAVERVASRWVPSSRLVRIENGIDLAPFAGSREERGGPSVRGELGLGDAPVVLSIGQLVPWKGIERLIDAARIVHGNVPDAYFLVAGGPGPADGAEVLTRLTREIESAGLTGFVHLLGARTDVPALLAAADLYVHPAFPEPFGRAVVEAMASGLAVVALAGDHGPAEIVRDGVDGVLAASRAPAELAAIIRPLLADPERRARLGAAGRERALERYGREGMVRRVAEQYEDVCAAAAS